MINQEKILMLGGSAQQVPAIKKAKELGYIVILIDYLPDNPGQFYADKWYQISTTDIDAVYSIAKNEGVKGILPYASDPAALPAAIVCEKLGLPTNPAKSVEILGVKHKFRNFLNEHKFACPKHFTFHTNTQISEVIELTKQLKFPIVIKPTDSSGSKGVSFVEDSIDIPNAIENAITYSRNKILIAEEFITRGYPDVIGGDIFVENGEIILFGDMACMRDKIGAGLIPIGKRYPNKLNDIQKENLRSELQRLITTLDIKNGELNIEILIDEDNQIHFLEVGPRAGGNMIPIQLSDTFKIDLIKANILVTMGKPSEISPLEPTECYMTYVIHSHKDGIYEKIQYSEEIEPYIYRRVHYKQPGDVVELFDGAGKALGIVFMKFPDEKTMNYFTSKCEDLIKPIC